METLQEMAAAVVHDACSMMQEAAAKMAEQVAEAATNLKADVEKSAQCVRDNAAKLTETAGTYQDVLARGVPSNLSTQAIAQHGSMLTPRSQAREGVRSRQILINITAVCIIQGMRLFILKKNKCLVNLISLSILHGMI